MPCKIHDHAPWPTSGPCNFEIQRCESICGWCDYSLPAKGSANNLRAHAKRHIVNEEAFRNIKISPFKAGRSRIQVTKVQSFQNFPALPRNLETPIVDTEEIADTLETNNAFNPRTNLSKATSLQITQGDQWQVHGYTLMAPGLPTRILSSTNTISKEKRVAYEPAGVNQASNNTSATHMSFSYPRITHGVDIYATDPSHSSVDKPTPLTLAWGPDSISTLLERYELIVPHWNEPYLILLEAWLTTTQCPKIVYLSPRQSCLTAYQCSFPGSCKRLFENKTLLGEHYRETHANECSKNWISCDYPSCLRDGYRSMLKHYDHLRSFHNEDLPILDKDVLITNDIQKQGYQVDPSWWRCSRCLGRVVALRLRCNKCDYKIEYGRRAIRILIDGATFVSSETSLAMTLCYEFRCFMCWIGGCLARISCPGCPLKLVRDGLEEYLDFRQISAQDPKKDLPLLFDIKEIIEMLDRYSGLRIRT